MSSRKVKVNGVMTKFSFDKNKKYKYNSSGNVVVATTISDDDIVMSGSKSSLRRMSDMERNISILATKTVTTAGALDVSIGEVDGLQTALDAKATPGDVSTSLNSAKSYTDGKVAGLVSSAPGTLDTLNELAAALGDDPNFATTVSNNIGGKVSKSGDTMTGTLNIGNNTAFLRKGNDGELILGATIPYQQSGSSYYRFFTDSYHPNADKWTTARTLSLSGDASGSVSWDGSANASLSVTVANDSHTHDTRYPQFQATFRSGAQNFDSLKTSGFHSLYNVNVSGSVNAPFQYGAMITAGNTAASGGMAMQIAHERTGAGTYIRGMNDSSDTWYDWDEIWTSGTDGAGSGLDADLLDGVQGSSYLRSDVENTTASFSGKVDFQGDAAIEGGAGYGMFKGYTGNYNHFITSRGIVSGTNTAPTITGGHHTTFVEHCDGTTNGFYFKSSNTGTYEEIARITRAGITSSGDITAYSDERLKSDIVTIPNALSVVNKLRGVNYVKDDKASTGVIAQEVEAVIPEVVHTADDDMGTKSVAYGNMMGVMIEAMKEMSAKVDALEAEIAELKKD